MDAASRECERFAVYTITIICKSYEPPDKWAAPAWLQHLAPARVQLDNQRRALGIRLVRFDASSSFIPGAGRGRPQLSRGRCLAVKRRFITAPWRAVEPRPAPPAAPRAVHKADNADTDRGVRPHRTAPLSIPLNIECQCARGRCTLTSIRSAPSVSFACDCTQCTNPIYRDRNLTRAS